MNTVRTNKKLGWTPDHPDFRDMLFLPSVRRVYPEVDLRPAMPPVYDQGDLGSCTANAIAAAMQYLKPDNWLGTNPSRLQIYYNERVLEGTVDSDSGAMIRDGIKTVVKQGAAKEGLCPYNINDFTSPPCQEAIDDGLNHQIKTYQRVNNKLVTTLKIALSNKHPIIFGFTVYESFFNLNSPWLMAMPNKSEKVVGGHAVLAVGYKKINGKFYFIIRNSWGDSWGDGGYFYMPTTYITNTNLCDDFWIVKTGE